MKLKQSMKMDLPTALSPCRQTWFRSATSGALKGAKKAQSEEYRLYKAMCSCHAYDYMKHGLSDGQVGTAA